MVAYHEIGHALVAALGRAILHRYRRLPLFQEPPEPLVIPCRWKRVNKYLMTKQEIER